MLTFGSGARAALLGLVFLGSPQEPNPVRWSVRAQSGAVAPGAVVHVTLAAAIDSGWHVYSLTQKPGGPIAMRVSVPTKQPVALAGDVRGPTPEVWEDTSFDIPVELYSGTAEFSVPLSIASSAPSGAHAIRIVASWQACSATTCLAPRSLELPLQVVVRGAP